MNEKTMVSDVMQVTSFRVAVRTMRRLRIMCAKRGVSQYQVINAALETFLDALEKEDAAVDASPDIQL